MSVLSSSIWRQTINQNTGFASPWVNQSIQESTLVRYQFENFITKLYYYKHAFVFLLCYPLGRQFFFYKLRVLLAIWRRTIKKQSKHLSKSVNQTTNVEVLPVCKCPFFVLLNFYMTCYYENSFCMDPVHVTPAAPTVPVQELHCRAITWPCHSCCL